MLSVDVLLGLLRETLRKPRAAARAVLSLGLPRPVLWEALALLAVMAAVLGEILLMGGPEMPGGGLFPGPFMLALVQGLTMAGVALVIYRAGRAFGGTGSFEGALALVVWLQAVMLVVQILQLVLVLVAPMFVDPLGALSVGLLFWLMANFVAELHGFKSIGSVLAGVVIGFVGLVILLSILLIALGVTYPGVA